MAPFSTRGVNDCLPAHPAHCRASRRRVGLPTRERLLSVVGGNASSSLANPTDGSPSRRAGHKGLGAFEEVGHCLGECRGTIGSRARWGIALVPFFEEPPFHNRDQQFGSVFLQRRVHPRSSRRKAAHRALALCHDWRDIGRHQPAPDSHQKIPAAPPSDLGSEGVVGAQRVGVFSAPECIQRLHSDAG